MDKVAILLVFFNDTEHIPMFAASLKRQSYQNIEIYAIETSSSGKSITKLLELYPQAKTFSYQGNLGFATGNNFLAKKAIEDGVDYLFVLNPDMELDANTIEVFIAYFKNIKNLGVISSTLLIGNTNKLQLFGVKAYFKTQKKEALFVNDNIEEVSLPCELVVDFVNGGSTFLSKEVYEKAGLFNESFFMYNDEIDFAYRVQKSGFITMVTSKTFIRHHHDWDSSNKVSYYRMYYYMMRNRYLYYKAHSLNGHLFVDLIKQIVLFPITFSWAKKTAGFKLIKYYYLGLWHGIMNKTGESQLNFH